MLTYRGRERRPLKLCFSISVDPVGLLEVAVQLGCRHVSSYQTHHSLAADAWLVPGSRRPPRNMLLRAQALRISVQKQHDLYFCLQLLFCLQEVLVDEATVALRVPPLRLHRHLDACLAGSAASDVSQNHRLAALWLRHWRRRGTLRSGVGWSVG